MQTVRPGCIVLEDDFDGVAHLGVEYWSEDPEIAVACEARFQHCEAAVCVLAVDGFAIHFADAMRTSRCIDSLHFVKRFAADLVDAGWSIVPCYLVHRDVIGTNVRTLCRVTAVSRGTLDTRTADQREPQDQKQQRNPSNRLHRQPITPSFGKRQNVQHMECDTLA